MSGLGTSPPFDVFSRSRGNKVFFCDHTGSSTGTELPCLCLGSSFKASTVDCNAMHMLSVFVQCYHNYTIL